MTERTFKRRLETGLAWTAAVVAWGSVALGFGGPLFSGSEPGLAGWVGFASETINALWVHGGFLALLSAAALALRRLWWPAVALLGVGLLTVAPEAWARSTAPPLLEARRSRAGDTTLRVAAVNLAWHVRRVDPRLQDVLREIDADVIVLSEFTRQWRESFADWFEDDYAHRFFAVPRPRKGLAVDGLSLGLWSRFPAAGPHEVVPHLGFGTQLRVPLRFQGRTVVVYGIHTNKPFPSTLYRSARRGRTELLGRMRREQGPFVVAGDFNAPPRSAFLARLRELGLGNASETALGYAPASWPTDGRGFGLLGLAIDHVMCTPELAVTGFGVGRRTESDHLPVFADLRLRR